VEAEMALRHINSARIANAIGIEPQGSDSSSDDESVVTQVTTRMMK